MLRPSRPKLEISKFLRGKFASAEFLGTNIHFQIFEARKFVVNFATGANIARPSGHVTEV